MAVLFSKSDDVEFLLRPYRILEEGRPTWIATQLELIKGGTALLSTTVTVANVDLADLRTNLRSVGDGVSDGFAITTMDDDFTLEVARAASEGDVAFGFWTGEPYDLMVGYRFITAASRLNGFADGLQCDEDSVAPPGHLP